MTDAQCARIKEIRERQKFRETNAVVIAEMLIKQAEYEATIEEELKDLLEILGDD